MQIICEKDNYYCTLLEQGNEEDFALFENSDRLCWPVEREDSYWRTQWDDPERRHFILFKRDETEMDIMIGVGSLSLWKPVPTLYRGAIAAPFRGARLSKILYSARLIFIVDATQAEFVMCEINVKNKASQVVAAEIGFRPVDRHVRDTDGAVLDVYGARIGHLRQPRNDLTEHAAP